MAVMPQDSPTLLRVKKAYEQVSDQLRDAIVSGDFAVGQRLPREVDLAETLGVSRSTVREALRVLASENLVRTTKGATGGTFIVPPSLDYVSEFMTTQINILTAAEEVTLDELIELRDLVEVEATRLAATRRTAEQLEKLEATVPPADGSRTHSEITALNRAFHLTILELAANRLMLLSAQPIYAAIETHSQQRLVSDEDHRHIVGEHAEVLDMIRRGDAEGAGKAMHSHLVKLRPLSERTWRQPPAGTTR
ncbi:MAG TPA: FadR/GntR family transcriptional regulator [Pseudolysinimonas sp.]|nr:FadR/GntR family transcriptional regulator [Pseudolysinimonas sp.]